MHIMRSGEFYGRRLHARSAEGLFFTDNVYVPGSRLKPHAHVNAFCAIVVAGGYRETAQGTSYECTPANVIFHRANEIHTNRMGDRGARVISIELGPEWMKRMSRLDVRPPEDGRAELGEAARLVPRLVAEIGAEDQASVLALEGLTLEILASLSREREGAARGERRAWLTRIAKLLDERYQEALTLAQLAECARVHPVHLARAFRKSFGYTVGERIRSLRVEHACRELVHTQRSITEIAARAGFADHSHMARWIRSYTGCSPGELRRRSRR